MNITGNILKTEYPIVEIFYSIQGEGYHQGTAAHFIRLGGCDVGCVWCDVKDSWNAEDHPNMDLDSIGAELNKNQKGIIIVTGGEPLMYGLDPMTKYLKGAGYQLHLETSGAYPISGEWDWVCISPKKFKPPVDSICQYADELKIVVFNASDFEWAEKYAEKVKPECNLYLQPEWGKEKEMMPLIAEYAKKHPKWMISLQIHKYLNIR